MRKLKLRVIVIALSLVYIFLSFSFLGLRIWRVSDTARAQTQWSYNTYSAAGVRWQDPDFTACTAATAQMALNMISINKSGNPVPYRNGDRVLPPIPFRWVVSVLYNTQESILSYERSRMTTPLSSAGSDPHGERNALNYFGWGSGYAVAYKDMAYTSFTAAAKAVVASIARTHKPAIVFVWNGAHSQLITGYQVTGANPATSNNFTIVGVYLTDPLKSENHRNLWISLSNWTNGPSNLKFGQYWQTDATGKDLIDGQVGKAEWYEKWVAVQAVN